MRGTMMDFPLTLPTLLERAGQVFPRVEITSRRPDRTTTRTCYGEFYRRARRVAAALASLGLQPGDRVASMMWNHIGHLEVFFGVPCAGGILHTLNLRLHPQEISAIAKHAGDRFLIVDDVLLPVYEKIRHDVPFEKVIAVPYGCGEIPGEFLNYEELIAQAGDDFRYPSLDENDGAAMCFTSGTTGFSKGVIYSHRALVLHSFACAMADSFAISNHDTVLPVAPMFHANAWGMPYTCVMTGARMVLPGPNVDPESVLDLLAQEHVTAACGVPTVWLGVLGALEKHPDRWKFSSPIRLLVGGTAPPLRLMRALDKHNLHIMHLWGMTETTPLATLGRLKSHMRDWSEDDRYEVRTKQGWLLFKAKEWLARLPFRQADLLVIDEIGKEISGSGMDTNVVGRKRSLKATPPPDQPQMRFIFVRGLSAHTHGNAAGIGLADFTTTRLSMRSAPVASREGHHKNRCPSACVRSVST